MGVPADERGERLRLWMVDSENEKTYFKKRLASVRKKLQQLSSDGPIRAFLTDDRVNQVEERIGASTVGELVTGYWPGVYLFVADRSLDELRALEEDIELVLSHTSKDRASQTLHPLKAHEAEGSIWKSGTFEVFAKSVALRSFGSDVQLDRTLRNGRDVDIVVMLDGKMTHVECTTLTDSDKEAKEWDELLREYEKDPDAELVQRPDLAYHEARFYLKVFDKLAPHLNPRQAQVAIDAPNILMVSLACPRTAFMTADGPGVTWALEGLMGKEHDETDIDTPVRKFLDRHARDLIERSELTQEQYDCDLKELLSMPSKLGAIVVFEECTLKLTRTNDKPDEHCRVSDKALDAITETYSSQPVWLLLD